MARPKRLMCRQIWMKVSLVCILAVAAGGASAQTPALSLAGASGAPGSTVTVSISLSSNGGTQPAGVQWDLTYSSSDLSPAAGTYWATIGAASAAGKQASCNV